MFIPALKQTIFTIRSKLLVYNRQHLFSKSHIYRSPSLRFTEAPTSNPLGKRWRSLSRFPWKTVSSGTSNAVAASARYHATSPSSLIKCSLSSSCPCISHYFTMSMASPDSPHKPMTLLMSTSFLSRFCFLDIESPRNHDSYYIMYPGCLHTFVDRLRGCFRNEAAPFFSGNISMLCKYISHMFIILF